MKRNLSFCYEALIVKHTLMFISKTIFLLRRRGGDRMVVEFTTTCAMSAAYRR